MKPSDRDILNELSKRKNKPFKLEDYLFAEQLAFVRDPAQYADAITSRRAGKTTSCAADLMDAIQCPWDGSTCLYITLSRANAKRLIWPALKHLNNVHSLGCEFNESELCVTSASGNPLYLSGASDRTEIEKFRGLALKKVYIDEAQSFPSFIEELVNDVLVPGLMDHQGKLRIIGTPGPIPNGYFFEHSKSTSTSHHFWTFFNNPHLPFLKKGVTHQQSLESELNRRGVGIDDPSIQREWFGRWVLDTNSLVYRYNSSVNDYDKLPREKYNYILGVDLGFNDADALAVLAWSDTSPGTYLVEEKVTTKQTISDLVAQVEHFRTKYDISKIVVDQGGLGKKIAEEISRRWAIPVQAAEKHRKVEYIELMNDALRTGRLMAPTGSRFAQDCMKVEWDRDKSTPDKKVISSRFHSDICEAVLYAWRESYSFTYEKPAPVYQAHTPAWAKQEEDKMWNDELEKLQSIEDAQNEDPWAEPDPKYKRK